MSDLRVVPAPANTGRWCRRVDVGKAAVGSVMIRAAMLP